MLPPPRLIIMGGSPAGRALCRPGAPDRIRRHGGGAGRGSGGLCRRWIGGSRVSISARSRLRRRASSSSRPRAGAIGQRCARRCFARARPMSPSSRAVARPWPSRAGWSRTAWRRRSSRVCGPGRARHRRHHAGRDRACDPRRHRLRAPARRARGARPNQRGAARAAHPGVALPTRRPLTHMAQAGKRADRRTDHRDFARRRPIDPNGRP